ncbi:hypothetical protein TeGR_g13782, partial [Tetraparma gracilis]
WRFTVACRRADGKVRSDKYWVAPDGRRYRSFKQIEAGNRGIRYDRDKFLRCVQEEVENLTRRMKSHTLPPASPASRASKAARSRASSIAAPPAEPAPAARRRSSSLPLPASVPKSPRLASMLSPRGGPKPGELAGEPAELRYWDGGARSVAGTVAAEGGRHVFLPAPDLHPDLGAFEITPALAWGAALAVAVDPDLEPPASVPLPTCWRPPAAVSPTPLSPTLLVSGFALHLSPSPSGLRAHVSRSLLPPPSPRLLVTSRSLLDLGPVPPGGAPRSPRVHSLLAALLPPLAGRALLPSPPSLFVLPPRPQADHLVHRLPPDDPGEGGPHAGRRSLRPMLRGREPRTPRPPRDAFGM